MSETCAYCERNLEARKLSPARWRGQSFCDEICMGKSPPQPHRWYRSDALATSMPPQSIWVCSGCHKRIHAAEHAKLGDLPHDELCPTPGAAAQPQLPAHEAKQEMSARDCCEVLEALVMVKHKLMPTRSPSRAGDEARISSWLATEHHIEKTTQAIVAALHDAIVESTK